MKIHEIEQKTPEWFKARRGKMTASHACEIGNVGKGLDTYINKLMSEYYSVAEPENITTNDIARGVELEYQARKIYELQNDVEIKEVGFIEYNNYVGCSPDGLIGEDGLIEIKCPKDEVFFKMLMNGEKEIDSKYLWQMQMQLFITGRKWCDFVAYNPNFTKSMFIFRVFPDEEKQRALVEGFKVGEIKIEVIKQKYDASTND